MLKHLIKRSLRRAGLLVHPLHTLPRGVDLFHDLARRWQHPRPMVFFDVGANVGQTTREMREAFPTAEIFAFEPVSATFASLRSSLGDRPGIHLHQMALGCADATCLVEAKPLSGSNRVLGVGQAAQGIPVEPVSLVRADTFCAQNDLAAIDLLKTDCEGYDLEVMRGASALLAIGAIDCIYCEVNFRRDGRHADFFAIADYLQPFGYGFSALYNYSGWQYDPIREGFANALFVRSVPS